MSDNGNERQAKKLVLTRHERKKKLHIHIAILHQGWIRWELHQMVMVFTHTERRFQWSSLPYSSKGLGRPVDSNCNRIVRDRPQVADYVLIVGADTVPPVNLFDILFEMQKKGEELPDVIGFPVPIWRGTNKPPTVAINIQPLEDQLILDLESGLTERAAIGSGTLLISRKIMDDPRMRGAFRFAYDEDGVTQQGEDHAYCQTARENGYKVWSADKHICDHFQEIGLLSVREAIYAAEVGVDALYGEGCGSEEQSTD